MGRFSRVLGLRERNGASLGASVALVAVAALLAGCGGGGTEARAADATTTTQEAAPSCAGYAGTGSKTLEPLTLDAPATLRWRADGDFFQVIMLNDRADIVNPQLLSSRATSGDTYLAAGYYELKISTWAASSWCVEIE